MTKIFAVCMFLFSFIQTDERKVPEVNLKALDGKMVNSSTFSNGGKPYLICFFATWCIPCKNELDAISDNLKDWQKQTGVKVIAVSIDDPKTSGKIISFVKTNGWDFEVYHDESMDFKRALGVVCSPHVFLVDGTNNIVWEHNSYKEGDEDEIFSKIKNFIRK